MDGTYMFCKQESVIQAARLLSKVEGLSLQVRDKCPKQCLLACNTAPKHCLYLAVSYSDKQSI